MLHMAQQWRQTLELNWVRTRAALLDAPADRIQKWQTEMDRTSDEAVAARKDLVAQLASENEDRRLLAAIDAARVSFRARRAELVQRRQAGEDVSVRAERELKPLAGQFAGAVAALEQRRRALYESRLAQAYADADRGRAIVLLGTLMSLLLGVAAAVMLRRSIVRPLDTAAEAAHAVVAASRQVAAGNGDLSQRALAQATSLERTAESMSRLADAARQHADQAKQADALALTACHMAVRGGLAVRRMVETATAIETSSREVLDALVMVDTIVQHTTALAASAAAEAAKEPRLAAALAEVQALSRRSVSCAAAMKALLEGSAARVRGRAAIAHEASESIMEVVASVRQITRALGQISAASQQHSAATSELNGALADMERDAQHSVVLVDRSSGAARCVEDEARTLMARLHLLKLGTPPDAAAA